MAEFKKHWRTGRHEDTEFRVEIWSGEGGEVFAKTIQIGEQTPILYSEGELTASDADAVFALAEAVVEEELQQREENADAEEDADDDDA
ncbi:hypothetical protein SAMN05428989_2417 [Pseudoxanthomonas sp. GM95]|uniref:hypothetical protein n=1 Tax=Pseudoxanthomonas sp. GM95 TaxID=1881043 RepID=UPI0008B3FBA6|nr:hypothetical protein [Pseudoxanthomonas sp. GM95]SEL75290.1 hypothetical protein SAMN05428989_2417 [Pseudoxanthomonas sp. GM95]